MLDMLINGEPLHSYGGSSLLNYTIGETPVDNNILQGINRTSWSLLKSTFGLRKITVTIVFEGDSLRAAKIQRSRLNGAIFGKCEIYIPGDGFFYTAYCDSMGEETLVGIGEHTAKIKAKYAFVGIRHDALVSTTVNGGVFCVSTMPYTDARLTATVGTAAASYQLGGATFANVAAGDVLTFDGIDKTILRNGVADASGVSWIHFPALQPGYNGITCPDPVTVEYYPTYI